MEATSIRWTPPWGSALPPPVRQTSDDTVDYNTPNTVQQVQQQRTIDPSDVCPICLEKEAATVIDACGHATCQGCLATWFTKRSRRPTCPLCNTELLRGYLVDLLGINPPIDENDNVPAVLDDLTSDWLAEEGAKQCPECGIWITKDGGCNHMDCVACGQEFCWYCLETHMECECPDETEDEDGDDEGE